MGQRMPGLALSAEDRFEIADFYRRVLGPVDTTDIGGAMAAFTKEAVAHYGTGERYEGVGDIRSLRCPRGR